MEEELSQTAKRREQRPLVVPLVVPLWPCGLLYIFAPWRGAEVADIKGNRCLGAGYGSRKVARTLPAHFTVVPEAETVGNSSVTLFKMQGNTTPLPLVPASNVCPQWIFSFRYLTVKVWRKRTWDLLWTYSLTVPLEPRNEPLYLEYPPSLPYLCWSNFCSFFKNQFSHSLFVKNYPISSGWFSAHIFPHYALIHVYRCHYYIIVESLVSCFSH